jgi:hypothetical protein
MQRIGRLSLQVRTKCIIQKETMENTARTYFGLEIGTLETAKVNFINTEALNWWYNKEHFIYRGEGIGKGEFEEYGHFTQMLWPDSQQVGCARVPYTAPNRSARTMVVCEYYPAGNILGKRLALTPETCDGVNLNGLTVSLK